MNRPAHDGGRLADDAVVRKYLRLHAEPRPMAPPEGGRWANALVIPAYRESPDLITRLSAIDATGPVLVVLVLNRPAGQSRADDNDSLRAAVRALPRQTDALYSAGAKVDLLLYDLERLAGPSPRAQGVGLARKAGCDLALDWAAGGLIESDWICCTDADATLPDDYFARLPAEAAVAATYPFVHRGAPSPGAEAAASLYELRMHHHVLGLAYAGSPYAHHSLGSCVAVRGQAYARVHGFPKRSGAEDFYLLNKVAKLGTIATLAGRCIELESRASERVPFGTGPAIDRIDTAGACALQLPLFYHPHSYASLRALMGALPSLYADPQLQLATSLAQGDISAQAAAATAAALRDAGVDAALAHCHRHSADEAAFLRHFHQWFDGFRTLKLLHALRDRGWKNQGFTALAGLQPRLWPGSSCDDRDAAALGEAIRAHWGWAA